LGATDPVAVVALLKELGASPTLTVQIQGESLLNDGTAIVVFTVMYNIVGGEEYLISDVIVLLVKTAVYAVVVGMTIGIIIFLWIKSVHDKMEHNSALIQVSLTVVCAYLSFSVAEGLLHISGVLSTVAASLVLAREMWAEVSCHETMHTIWHMFEYLGNTIIFFLAGALTGKSMVSDATWADYGYLIAIYLGLIVIRFFMLFVSRPILRLLHPDRQPVTIADTIVMGWGGLRGAVGLALSIQVAVNKADGKIAAREAHRVLFYVGGVAFLTLLINATTCPALVKYLGITQLPKAKQKLMLLVHRRLVEKVKGSHHDDVVKKAVLDVLLDVRHHIDKSDPGTKKNKDIDAPKCIEDLGFVAPGDTDRHHTASTGSSARTSLQTTSWVQAKGLEMARGVQMVIGGQVGRDTLQKRSIADLETSRRQFKTVPDKIKQRLREVLDPNPSDDHEHEMIRRVREFRSPLSLTRAINEAFLALLRASYSEQMEKEEISPQAGEILVGSLAHSMSFPAERLNDFDFIQKQFGCIDHERSSRAVMWRRMRLFQSKASVGKMESGTQVIRGPQAAVRIVMSPFFTIAVMIAISLNAIWIFADVRLEEQPWSWVVELIFAVFFAFECVMKLMALGRYYFHEWRNLFDAVLVLVGIVANVLRFTQQDEQVARVLKVLLISRALMILRLMKLVQDTIEQMKPLDEASRQASENIMKFNVLVGFCKAHADAQQKMLEFFGRKGKADLVEVCLCLIQSQASIYKAKSACTQIEQELDDWRLEETIVCEKQLKATWELERFVNDAKEAGVLSVREAESIIHTMHSHSKRYQEQLKTILGGGAVKPLYCKSGEDGEPRRNSEVLTRPPVEHDVVAPPRSAPMAQGVARRPQVQKPAEAPGANAEAEVRAQAQEADPRLAKEERTHGVDGKPPWRSKHGSPDRKPTKGKQ